MYNYTMSEKQKTLSENELAGLRLQLHAAYTGLIRALTTLAKAIEEDVGFVWVARNDGDAPTFDPRRTIADCYGNLSCDKADPKNTDTRFGLIGASPVVLEAAVSVNAQKDILKSAIADIRRHERNDMLSDVYTEVTRTPLLRDAMRRFGISHINIKQSTRKIGLLSEQPKRVGFTLARRGHIVEKISYEKAIKMSAERGLVEVTNKIESLGPDTEFVRRREQAPHVRANITYHDGLRIKGRSNQVPAPMPLMYPINPALKNKDPVHNGNVTEILIGLKDDEIPRDARSRSSLEWYVDIDRPISQTLKLYAKIRNASFKEKE